MKFGEDKYTVMRAEKGKVINSDTPLKPTDILVKKKISSTVVQLIKKEFDLST